MNKDNDTEQIEKIASNARATWFGLLALLVFIGVTLMGHEDSDFFAYRAATKLPIVGVDVPPSAFFIVAPILASALYCYMHLFLLSLWSALGQIKQDRLWSPPPVGDRVFPTLFTLGGLLYRSMCRKDDCIAPREFGVLTVIIVVLIGWGFGIVILAWLWWRSMPAHEPLPTIAAGVCLWLAGIIGLRTILTAHQKLSRSASKTAIPKRPGWALIGGFTLFFIVGLSWERIGGDFIEWHDEKGLPVLMARANLRETELTAKPREWPTYAIFHNDFEDKFRERMGVHPTDILTPELAARLESQVLKRRLSQIQSLDGDSLQGRDLRGADLRGAFLVGADLRAARLDGATFEGAQLTGADLSGAEANQVDFSVAQLLGINFRDAWLWNTKFVAVNLDGANFTNARLEGAVFGFANLRGLKFQNSNMRGVNFGIGVTKLEQEDLEVIFGDCSTFLGHEMRPPHWDEKTTIYMKNDQKFNQWKNDEYLWLTLATKPQFLDCAE